jgi:poly-gamma-glutamate synthesis protein (capsule biosynthesis protein)
VLSGFTLKEGKLAELKLYPITMGHEKPVWQRGIPTLADEATGRTIIKGYQELSKPFGTQIDYRNGIGVAQLKR